MSCSSSLERRNILIDYCDGLLTLIDCPFRGEIRFDTKHDPIFDSICDSIRDSIKFDDWMSYAKVDSEGSNIVKSIDDYYIDVNDVSKENQFLVDKYGRRHFRKTTAGWKLRVVLTNGATRWILLKDLKESNPIDAAEFVVSRGIDDEPAFKWWVPYNTVYSSRTRYDYICRQGLVE